MKENKYKELLLLLNTYVDDDLAAKSVSPTPFGVQGDSLTPNDIYRILKLLYIKKNKPVIEIARMLDCNRRTIHRHLKKHKLTKGRKKSLTGRKQTSMHISNKIKAGINNNKQDTDIERLIENQLLFQDIIYVKQLPYKYGIADFWLPETNTIIECDGDYWHDLPNRQKNDYRNTKYLEEVNYIVHRFKGSEIKNNIKECMSIVCGD